MKVLHKIFHKDLFRNYAIIFMGTLVSMYLIKTIPKDAGGIMSLILDIAHIFRVLGPALFLFSNLSFFKNIPFLINQHFNRSELIKFFFFSQSLKFFLVVVNYVVIIVIYTLLSTPSEKKQASDFYLTYFEIYFVYLGLLFTFFLIFFVPLGRLFSITNHGGSTHKINMAWKKLYLRKAIIAYVFLIIFYQSPTIVKMYIGGLGITMLCARVLIDKFKLFNEKKSYNVSLSSSLAISAPLLLFIFLIRTELKDSNVPIMKKTDAITMMGVLNPVYSNNEMLAFLKETKSVYRYNELLNLFSRELSVEQTVETVNKPEKSLPFLKHYMLKNLSPGQVDSIIEMMSNYSDFLSGKDKKSFLKLSGILIDKNFNNLKFSEYTNNLLSSESRYKQYIAFRLAARKLNNPEYEKFMQDNVTIKDTLMSDPNYQFYIATEKLPLKRSVAGDKIKSKQNPKVLNDSLEK